MYHCVVLCASDTLSTFFPRKDTAQHHTDNLRNQKLRFYLDIQTVRGRKKGIFESTNLRVLSHDASVFLGWEILLYSH